MIRSMTGFGRASFSVDGVGFEVEVRSVNHRYLDLRVRLPRPLAELESEAKALLRESLQRGKVELVLALSSRSESRSRVRVDREAAEQYLEAARELAGEQEIAREWDVTSLLALPGVARFVEPELPRESLSTALRQGVASALATLESMRVSEGKALERELAARLENVLARLESLGERSGEVQSRVREKLRKRAAQLRNETGLLDEARLHQEVVIAADRLDITEEVVRLRSHVDQFRSIVADSGAGKPAGRRLDFLTQEMAREANTIGSKGSDAPISHDVVELKTEIERIREQVRNIE